MYFSTLGCARKDYGHNKSMQGPLVFHNVIGFDIVDF